jgi:aurora kinase
MIKESDMIRQLKQEIKIQLFLDHPNILKMFGFFDDVENIYLILEAIPLGNVFR